MPALREHRTDMLQLADHFIERFSQANGKTVRRISTAAIDMLMAYHWPGNVRELENCIERAVLLCEGDASRPVICRPPCSWRNRRNASRAAP